MVGETPRTGRDGIVVLAAVCLAALILPLGFSGGAVATPAVGRDLGGSAVALNWITNAFMLTFGSSLMAAGTLADRYGRRRLFALGVAAFTGLSVLIGLAPSVFVVDLLRAFQGLAAAAALAGGAAALAQEFDGHARTRAFSALGTTFGLGLAFGPLLAGALIETFGWRSAFLSPAVVGALASIFGVPRMRESRDPAAARLDWRGMLAFTAMLTLFTFGVVQAPASGWSSPTVVGLLLASALMLVVFVAVETRIEHPMLDLSLFRYPRFVGVQMLPIATCFCYVVLLVLLPLRFIGVEGRSAIDAGLLMAALSVPMLIVPFLAALLTRWFSAGLLSGAGLMLAAFGLWFLGRVDPADGGGGAIASMLTIGIGAGLPWGLMDGLSVSVVPKERAGMATGIFGTTRVAGEGIALAMVTAILSALAETHLRRADLPSTAPLAEAAQRLAAGDVDAASRILPEVARAVLVRSYAASFHDLTWILVAVTVASAVAAVAFLRRPS